MELGSKSSAFRKAGKISDASAFLATISGALGNVSKKRKCPVVKDKLEIGPGNRLLKTEGAGSARILVLKTEGACLKRNRHATVTKMPEIDKARTEGWRKNRRFSEIHDRLF